MTDELRPQRNSSGGIHAIPTPDLTARRLLAAELRAGRPVSLTVATDSMAPALRPGDLLAIVPCAPRDLSCGDVILFERDDEWVVHRIMGVRLVDASRLFLTRGDQSERADPPVTAAVVLGRCAALTRHGRRLTPPPALPRHLDAALLQASFGVADGLAGWVEARGWPRFFAATEREGLAGLTAAALACYLDRPAPAGQTAGAAGAKVPADVIARFAGARRAAAARNLLCLDALQEVMRALDGIPVIILKGACLAAAVYDAPAMRLFSDIDLLIDRAAVPQALAKLADLHYQRPDAGAPPPPGTINSVMLTRPGGVGIHLHWHLFNSVRDEYAGLNLDMQKIWHDARPIPAGGLMLSPAHLVLHLAEHAMRHSFNRLIWLRDIAEVIINNGGTGLAWDELVRTCRNCGADQGAGLCAPVYHALFYVSRMMPVHIPGQVLEQLCPPPLRAGDRLCRQLALRGRRIPELGLPVYLARLPDARARRRYVWRALAPAQGVDAGVDAGPANGVYLISRLASRARLMARIIAAWCWHIPPVLFSRTSPRK